MGVKAQQVSLSEFNAPLCNLRAGAGGGRFEAFGVVVLLELTGREQIAFWGRFR